MTWIVERWSAGKGGWIAVATSVEHPDDFLARFSGFRAVADLPDISVIVAQATRVDNPVEAFHRERGCCDGSDPAACHRRMVATEEAKHATDRKTTKPKSEQEILEPELTILRQRFSDLPLAEET